MEAGIAEKMGARNLFRNRASERASVRLIRFGNWQGELETDIIFTSRRNSRGTAKFAEKQSHPVDTARRTPNALPFALHAFKKVKTRRRLFLRGHAAHTC